MNTIAEKVINVYKKPNILTSNKSNIKFDKAVNTDKRS